MVFLGFQRSLCAAYAQPMRSLHRFVWDHLLTGGEGSVCGAALALEMVLALEAALAPYLELFTQNGVGCA